MINSRRPSLPRALAHAAAALAPLTALGLCALWSAPAAAQQPTPNQSNTQPADVLIRVATFNIQDLRTNELTGQPSERATRAAEVIQRLRPNIILINEIAYDMPGAPDFLDGQGQGRNAERLAQLLRTPAAPGLEPLDMTPWSASPNTGRPSNLDLDRNGRVVTMVPPPDAPPQDLEAYAGDAWGYGVFPGQYGMALLVDARLEIDEPFIRTFRLMPWAFMPGHLMPTVPDDRGNPRPWHDPEAAEIVRLSSKSHWDIPVKLPNGARVHLLCSHPTPPAFDGPERRNKARNHDEIRFWADYVSSAEYIIDDAGRPGSLTASDRFIILGDLNADPDEGDSINDPIGLLFNTRRLAKDHAPTSDRPEPGLNPDDTATFGLRVDYVLPSAHLEIIRSGVWRHPTLSGPFPSDHFPVWADLRIPPP